MKSNPPGFSKIKKNSNPKRIVFDPTRPLCDDCSSTWVQFENPDFPENVCHHCGEYEETSMRKPMCYDCFQLFR